MRVQEMRGVRFVTIARRMANGKRVGFTIRTRKGIRTYRIVHAEGTGVFRIRVR